MSDATQRSAEIARMARNPGIRSVVVRRVTLHPEAIDDYDKRFPGLCDAIGVNRARVAQLRQRDEARAARVTSLSWRFPVTEPTEEDKRRLVAEAPADPGELDVYIKMHGVRPQAFGRWRAMFTQEKAA